jgi:hypothetical protein
LRRLPDTSAARRLTPGAQITEGGEGVVHAGEEDVVRGDGFEGWIEVDVPVQEPAALSPAFARPPPFPFAAIGQYSCARLA